MSLQVIQVPDTRYSYSKFLLEDASRLSRKSLEREASHSIRFQREPDEGSTPSAQSEFEESIGLRTRFLWFMSVSVASRKVKGFFLSITLEINFS